MNKRMLAICAVIVSAIALCAPDRAFARGGGGHGGGGGGHFGGYGGGFHGYGGGWGGRGYGWGYRGYGWGYPYGYGLGLGFGLGLGYGYYGGWGYGYPGYGYGGYGYPGYGYGYGGYPGYGYDGYPAYAPGSSDGYESGTYAPNPNDDRRSQPVPPEPGTTSRASQRASLILATDSTADAESKSAPESGTAAAPSAGWNEEGAAAFKAADYPKAVYDWRHASVDAPHDPLTMMLLAQGLLAIGKFDEAAGATQAAMRLLPSDEWNVVVRSYQALYGNARDYTEQLRALERAIREKPAKPGLRFLAGFHYGYLGYPQQAINQLDATLKLAPRDELARQLRNERRERVKSSAASTAPQKLR